MRTNSSKENVGSVLRSSWIRCVSPVSTVKIDWEDGCRSSTVDRNFRSDPPRSLLTSGSVVDERHLILWGFLLTGRHG